jgi:glycosyltransferase involved in cell wall biosynthesis
MEWFSKKQYFLNGLFSIPYHKNNSFIRQFKKQDGKIVAISRYLNEYFSSKGIQSLYLPFVFDENHFATLPRKSHKGINIFYIGRSRNKDDLYRMLVGFDIAKEKIDGKVNVFIVGENRKTIRKARNNNLLHDWIVVKGEVNNQEALELLSNADYTVLLRPPHERFAKAGFPTKVAESLFAGVPVITNLTSNLSDYLVDGANSIIVNDYSAKAFSEAIIRAVSVTGDDYENMRIEARKTALDNLEAGLFSEDFRKFLNDN